MSYVKRLLFSILIMYPALLASQNTRVAFRDSLEQELMDVGITNLPEIFYACSYQFQKSKNLSEGLIEYYQSIYQSELKRPLKLKTLFTLCASNSIMQSAIISEAGEKVAYKLYLDHWVKDCNKNLSRSSKNCACIYQQMIKTGVPFNEVLKFDIPSHLRRRCN